MLTMAAVLEPLDHTAQSFDHRLRVNSHLSTLTTPRLLRQNPDSETVIADLHVWRVGKAAYACAISVVTHDTQLSPHTVRGWLSVHEEIVHSTVEIHQCPSG